MKGGERSLITIRNDLVSGSLLFVDSLAYERVTRLLTRPNQLTLTKNLLYNKPSFEKEN